ncbi:BRCA1-associated protein [Trypanosoma grayi]|uniref:BRCA1-associated protein n=1 Tax=Trypanosoma grayi TaxID=71804 RepID=UPI0004F4A99A|nr:BRCA1-associated protein [Trypanosoma grayi]KEG15305.1 BRCA1-associated protein [Trypanosoma grayi]
MLRYQVADIQSDDQTCEALGDRPVRLVVGRVQLLRRLGFKREFFVPFIPTKCILLLFQTCNPLNGLALTEEALGIVTRYLEWLTNKRGQLMNVLELLVCTLSGCVLVIIECADVLSALEVHSLTQEDTAPSVGNRRVFSFPCDKDPIPEEEFDNLYIVPTCTICAERLEPTLTGYTSRTCRCATSKDCACFLEQSSCTVCQTLIKMQRESNGVQCEVCKVSGDPWICLVCGFVGCSRYQAMHAREHFLQKRHLFSMSLLTQQIWDYDSDAFVHRIVVVFDNVTGVTHRVQYPDRDNMPTSLEDDTGDLVTETAKKKHINAKYDSKVEMSNEQLALMIKNELDTRRAEYESERQQQRLLLDQVTGQNVNDSDVYNIMGSEAMYGTNRQRWISVFLANQSLEDELQQRRHEESMLLESAQKYNDELRYVIRFHAMQDGRLTADIADLKETIKEVETNLRMRQRIAEQLGEDGCERVYVVGSSTRKASTKPKRQPPKAPK